MEKGKIKEYLKSSYLSITKYESLYEDLLYRFFSDYVDKLNKNSIK